MPTFRIAFARSDPTGRHLPVDGRKPIQGTLTLPADSEIDARCTAAHVIGAPLAKAAIIREADAGDPIDALAEVHDAFEAERDARYDGPSVDAKGRPRKFDHPDDAEHCREMDAILARTARVLVEHGRKP